MRRCADARADDRGPHEGRATPRTRPCGRCARTSPACRWPSRRCCPCSAAGGRSAQIEPYGLEALVATTVSVLPEAARRAFVVAQRHAIEQQVVEARGDRRGARPGGGAARDRRRRPRRRPPGPPPAADARGHQRRVLADGAGAGAAIARRGGQPRPGSLHVDGAGPGGCSTLLEGPASPGCEIADRLVSGGGRRGRHPRAGRRPRAALPRAARSANARGPAAADGPARARFAVPAVTGGDHSSTIPADSRPAAGGARCDEMPACNIVVVGKTGRRQEHADQRRLRRAAWRGPASASRSRSTSARTASTGVPVTIVDSRGIELSDDLPAVTRELDARDRRPAARPGEAGRLHVLWYCVAAEGARFEPDAEGALIRRSAGAPACPCSSCSRRPTTPPTPRSRELTASSQGGGCRSSGVLPVLAERALRPGAARPRGAITATEGRSRGRARARSSTPRCARSTRSCAPRSPASTSSSTSRTSRTGRSRSCARGGRRGDGRRGAVPAARARRGRRGRRDFRGGLGDRRAGGRARPRRRSATSWAVPGCATSCGSSTGCCS